MTRPARPGPIAEMSVGELREVIEDARRAVAPERLVQQIDV